MRKAWLVAVSTYRQRVRSGTFLMLTFGLPLLMLIVGAITFFVQERERTLASFGIVDETGNAGSVEQVQIDDEGPALIAFPDQGAAQAARGRGDIKGYLVVPADYAEGEPPTLHLDGEPSPGVVTALENYLRRAVAPDAPDWILARLAEPAEFIYTDSTQEVAVSSGPGLILRVLTPVVLAILFGLTVFTSTNQMGPSMVREKDQRAMEMVLTSLSPAQLVTGKVLGMSLLSLTQLGVWVLGAAVALGLAFGGSLGIQMSNVPWQTVAWALLLGVPAYFLYASLAAGLGIIAGDSQQARQLAGILGFLGLAPFWFVGAIVGAPDSPLSLALTFFPLTSPMISLVRMALTAVPLWQLSLALVLIVISLLASIWFVARIFRAAMLLYGQALRPRTIWQVLRTA